jgi:hypothetical protein
MNDALYEGTVKVKVGGSGSTSWTIKNIKVRASSSHEAQGLLTAYGQVMGAPRWAGK